MIYEYDKESGKKNFKGQIAIGAVILFAVIALIIASNIYMEIIQLKEIGKGLSGVYLTNLLYKSAFSAAAFIIIFLLISVTTIFIKRNIKSYMEKNSLPVMKMPNLLLAAAIGLIGAFACKEFFYQKAINFLNSTSFGKAAPIFGNDVGYYVFQRPFLMSLYQFISTVWVIVIIYTALYYISIFLMTFTSLTLQDLKVKSIIRHNLINIAIFFVIKALSYKFTKEGILYSTVVTSEGANYVDVNVWLKYFTIAPFLLILIVAVAFIFIWRNKLKQAAVTIAAFPAIWIVVFLIAAVMQSFIVKPNETTYELNYLKNNMEKTREAYNIDNIKSHVFPTMQELTPDIINKNLETKNNIRIVDYKPTLDSDTQLQSIRNFYSFQDGDIINYSINGKEIPVFITAREIDKSKLPEQNYINTMFKYTHGYGVVINPINKLTTQGQVDFLLNGLNMASIDPGLKVSEPRIYYGELTKDNVIVNPKDSSKLKEIDYDGNSESNYEGKGGIKLGLLNKSLFALKYADFNMFISGNISSESKLLLNREIVARAQKAVPFLSVDHDPYVMLTSDGRLKWVLDAYTTTDYYPSSQSITSEYQGSFNYIRNSVKIVIDAYDGSVKYYIVDQKDPIIQTYKKAYPGIFSDEPIPADLAQHMRYPEFLFKVQTEMLKSYHLNPENIQNVSMFYSQQDKWDIAKYPDGTNTISNPDVVDSSNVKDIDPYYNMIKLPDGIGSKEELILMRPFTPSKKNNMVSWLAVRNSSGENYGQLILFSFPKDTNIIGPYQAEVNINQIDEVSKDMTLWGQKGSRVFKGSLLTIPLENSVLYVEPIYIQSTGESSIPQVRKIIVLYQKGDDFKHGVGDNLDAALSNLFQGIAQAPVTPGTTAPPNTGITPPATTPVPGTTLPPATGTTDKNKIINDLKSRSEEIQKQLNELTKLLNQLQ